MTISVPRPCLLKCSRTWDNTLTALRFLFMVTLRKPEVVARLLDAAPGLRYKAALSVAYGAGLRATEVISCVGATS
jgi:hypothetical protein